MFLFKVLLTSSASAVLSAGFAIPGSYERLMFYFAYLFDCAAHGNNPTTIAPGCARYYMLQGPCDLNQFINYISQNRSNNMKVAKVTNIKFPGRPPLEVADEITRMKLAGPVRTGLIINSAKDRPYSVALAQVGQFIAEMIATAKSSRELQTMAHHAMQRALISRKAATLEAVVRDLDPGSDLEMTKVVLKNEPLYASETVTEAIDIIETAKHAGISAEEVKDALRSQDSLFHELYRFVVASGTAKSEAQGTAALLDKKIQHHIIILRYKRSLTTPAIDALSNAQEGERNVMPPRQCQIIDIEETLSLNEAPTALTADELIALLQRAGIKTFKTYAMKTVPAYQSMVEIKTIDVLGTVATLGIKPSELRQVINKHFRGGHRDNIKALEQSLWAADSYLDPLPVCWAARKRQVGKCGESVEFLEIEDMGQEKAVKDPVEGDSQTDLTTNDSMTEHAEDLSLQRAERNAHKLEEGASESPWLMNIYGAVVVGINSLAGGAAATALTVTMSDPTKIADGAGAVISAGGTPLTPSSPVFQQSVSIQEAVDVIREVLSPKKAQQILRKWAPARGKAQAQPQLVPASRKRRYPMAVESRGKPSGEEWIFQALRPALDQALLDTLQLAIDEAQREMALPVL